MVHSFNYTKALMYEYELRGHSGLPGYRGSTGLEAYPRRPTPRGHPAFLSPVRGLLPVRPILQTLYQLPGEKPPVEPWHNQR
jgi:hypothetical protein